MALPVLVLILVSYRFLHSGRVEAKGSQSSKLRELQEQRLATLRNLVKMTTDRFKTGQASSEELRSAIRAQQDAELDLCSSDQERITILERAVAEAKVREEQDAKIAANKSCLKLPCSTPQLTGSSRKFFWKRRGLNMQVKRIESALRALQ